MLPGSLLAAALLLSLVPGWLFLRLTDKIRRPKNQTDLQEILELIAVGIATTGVAVLVSALIYPDGYFELSIPPESSSDVRELAWTVSLVFLLALAAAAGLAGLWHCIAPEANASLGISVWWDVLSDERLPKGKLPYVFVTLKESGSVVEGPLATYTWQSDAGHHRDIALKKPIRVFTGQVDSAGVPIYRDKPYDRMIIAGDEIKDVSLMYVDR